MSKEVRRYCLGEFAEPHTYPIGPGAHVLATDYDALRLELAEANADFVRIANEREALLADRDALKKVLKNLRAATPSLTCESFHHARRDLHDHDEECPPFERWIAAALACNAVLQGEQP